MKSRNSVIVVFVRSSSGDHSCQGTLLCDCIRRALPFFTPDPSRYVLAKTNCCLAQAPWCGRSDALRSSRCVFSHLCVPQRVHYSGRRLSSYPSGLKPFPTCSSEHYLAIVTSMFVIRRATRRNLDSPTGRSGRLQKIRVCLRVYLPAATLLHSSRYFLRYPIGPGKTVIDVLLS
jgi:hypothetical protein